MPLRLDNFKTDDGSLFLRAAGGVRQCDAVTAWGGTRRRLRGARRPRRATRGRSRRRCCRSAAAAARPRSATSGQSAGRKRARRSKASSRRGSGRPRRGCERPLGRPSGRGDRRRGRAPAPAVRRGVVAVRRAPVAAGGDEKELVPVPNRRTERSESRLGRRCDPAPRVPGRVIRGRPREPCGPRSSLEVEPADDEQQLMPGPRAERPLARRERAAQRGR